MSVMTKSYFQQLFEYDVWANERTLEMLREIVTDHARARGLLAHILAAQLVWMTRLHERDASGIALWPDQTLDQCEAWMEHHARSYASFLGAMNDETLDHEIKYVNSQGRAFTTPVGRILLHVAHHGAYHRGQIALAIRESGRTPVNTDFITWTRLETTPSA